MITPILETDRLILRLLKIDDAEEVFKNWSSDSETTKYMEWDMHTNINVTKEWLNAEEKLIYNDKNYTWGLELKKTGALIGSGGITYNPKVKMYEIGYIIMRQYWGQGIISEAVEKIIHFAKSQLGINELFAKHAKKNLASRHILEKMGFVYLKDGKYSKFSGDVEFESREYILRI
ncbi:GNAT family N-acetyltransferase [Aminobacterium sp. MB27-C1]|jgi:ribosomal-protein-alanine N-acetyltransferase|uniref:GNAT family N-acetyltransferase n=1 Tax=Aminobacterium sp. MB27-C1 TaxID=3070661 RepID=UPI001BCF2485|nr:GNAT family N-acetyltransferase [Aminobacterium sp. MB27-C1]WMI70453.1 GNAT family N-acetyltransferase [Aminobacterium sp. MB27-C1]